jgi:hypothetical protein
MLPISRLWPARTAIYRFNLHRLFAKSRLALHALFLSGIYRTKFISKPKFGKATMSRQEPQNK